MKNEKKIIGIGIFLFVFVILVISSSYAYWRFQKSQLNANVISSKCFDLTFDETRGSDITLLKTYPISEEEGQKTSPYIAKLVNKCDNDLTYHFNLEILSATTLKEEFVKVQFQNELKFLNLFSSTDIYVKGAKKAYELENGVIGAHETKEFQLRLWLDQNSPAEEAMSKVFDSKVSVVASYQDYRGKYTEDILNGADPVLADGLVPVTIAEDGTVNKANLEMEWYRYQNKRWANAVILVDENTSYQNGEVIPESNIESYFVWIPRYRYQILDDGFYTELSQNSVSRASEIAIVFENRDVKISSGKRKGEWLTHPAFTSFDVNGMWVGKFETSYGDGSYEDSQKNEIAPEKVQIKPNVASWRGINVANAFQTSYQYQRNLDSHMMKNTEWGAVAYLSHSKYGIQDSVRLNNTFITGVAALKEPTCGYTGNNEECNKYSNTFLESLSAHYNTSTGYLASTTGNITGIYDMSGGAWEYVMGVMADKNGRPMSGRSSQVHSGFSGSLGCPTCDSDTSGITEITNGIDFPESKYYDLYGYNENTLVYNRRLLGDATGELGGFMKNEWNRYISSWYQDHAEFLKHWYPFFFRSGLISYGTGAGIFFFSATSGLGNSGGSYRIVLAY